MHFTDSPKFRFLEAVNELKCIVKTTVALCADLNVRAIYFTSLLVIILFCVVRQEPISYWFIIKSCWTTYTISSFKFKNWKENYRDSTLGRKSIRTYNRFV